MSGDHGAEVAVPAALDVLAATPDLQLLLVGRGDVLRPLARRCRCRRAARSSRRAKSSAWTSGRRTRSGARRTPRCASPSTSSKKGEATACVSAGNTGALLATARFVLGMIPGIDRPAIVSAVPAAHGHTVMLDLGANPDCSADHLVQFAVMGSVIATDLHGIERPRVGLLNIGEEDIKGTDEIREAHRRLDRGADQLHGLRRGRRHLLRRRGRRGDGRLHRERGAEDHGGRRAIHRRRHARGIHAQSVAQDRRARRGPVAQGAQEPARPERLQRREHGRSRRAWSSRATAARIASRSRVPSASRSPRRARACRTRSAS